VTVQRITAKEARFNLSEYLERVDRLRERFTITRWGRAVAKMVPVAPKPGTRYRVEAQGQTFTADSLQGLAEMIGDEVEEARAWVRQGALVVRVEDAQGHEETRWEADEMEVGDE